MWEMHQVIGIYLNKKIVGDLWIREQGIGLNIRIRFRLRRLMRG